MADGLKLLSRLFWQPGAAMGAILDRGSLLFASVTVLAVSLLLQSGAGQWLRFGFYVPLFILAVVYVPGVLLLGRLTGADADFRRDYSPC